jgi:Fur family ferric uptake transcriptional regulator
MTDAPEAPRLSFETLDGAVSAMRSRGLRLSTARRLILEALFADDEPASAEQIAQRSNLDLASVYRNLETMERHGLVRHVHLGHGPGLYVLVGSGDREYLHCQRCGAVRAVSPDELDPIRDTVKELFGYEARFTHFAIVGLCPRCAADPAVPASEVRNDRHSHDHDHPDAHQHEHGHAHGQ